MEKPKPEAKSFIRYLDDTDSQLIETGEALQELALHLMEYPMESVETCAEVITLLSVISEDLHAEMKRRLLPESDPEADPDGKDIEKGASYTPGKQPGTAKETRKAELFRVQSDYSTAARVSDKGPQDGKK